MNDLEMPELCSVDELEDDGPCWSEATVWFRERGATYPWIPRCGVHAKWLDLEYVEVKP